jgi:hypothetical protein
MSQQKTDQPKLQELILYLASKMDEDQHVGRGRIKLAKLIWRCDFGAFWKLGEPITETTYVADEHGPAPVGELLATRDLEAAGRLEWHNEWDRQQIPVALDTPHLDVFSAEQLELIHGQLDEYRYVTGAAMRAEAHEFPGWQQAWRDGAGQHAPVPFESVFWDARRELEDWEQGHAALLAKSLKSDS